VAKVVCSSRCEEPEGIPEDTIAIYSTTTQCELAITIEDNIEAIIYYQNPPVGDNLKQCSESTNGILVRCFNNGEKDGWVNGPSVFQYYQLGFRPVNHGSSLHAPLLGVNHTLKVSPKVNEVSSPTLSITLSAATSSRQRIIGEQLVVLWDYYCWQALR
jgi:hypothetical protein